MRTFLLRHRMLGGIALLLIALAVVAGGRHWWRYGRFAESTDDAFIGGDVTVIASKVAGFIAEVAVTDNQPVRAGDLLIRIDDRDYRAALDKASAAQAAQQAAIANLDALHALQDAVIAQGRAAVAGADAEIERARYDQERYKALSESAAASVQTFQKADAVFKEARAGADKARASLVAAQRELAVLDTRKLQAQAALAGAEAERTTAALNLEYTQIRSPIDGVVGNRAAHLGAYAVTGAQLVSIVPDAGLWVDANFKESQLRNIHPGDPVAVRADAIPGEVLQGHVVSLAPATGAQFSILPAENATGNFTKIVQRVPVRVRLDERAAMLGRLRPGLSVYAEVDGRPTGSDTPKTARALP